MNFKEESEGVEEIDVESLSFITYYIFIQSYFYFHSFLSCNVVFLLKCFIKWKYLSTR